MALTLQLGFGSKKMQNAQEKSRVDWKSVQPQKKVTFYGPVISTKAEKLRPVRIDTTTRRQKPTLMSLSSSPSFNQISQSNRKLRHHKSKSSETRPHAKMTVMGNQLKTRLNCNHMRPKCQCSGPPANKAKQSRVKGKPSIADVRETSHILTSTCTVPRGGLNGRKIYASKDNRGGISILDANWRPSQLTFKENDMEESKGRQKTSPSNENESNKQNTEDISKKRVQFSDKTNSGDVSHENLHAETSQRNPMRRNNNLDDYETRHEKSKHPEMTGINDRPDPFQRRHSHNNSVHDSESHDDYSEKDVDDYDSTSSVSESRNPVQEIHQERCTLCESPRFRYPTSPRFRRMNSASDFVTSGVRDPGTRSFNISPSRKKYNDDLCALCKRQSRRSYSVDDRYCYHCDSTDLDSYDAICHHRHMKIPRDHGLKNFLPRRQSVPVFFSDGDEEILQRNRIPYEPKTELVKDLKKKLEREYRNQDYLHHLVHHRRKWKSWDAEDLEELRQYRSRRAERHRYWDYDGPPHKCVHHYLQNDRLYLEPTLTNKEGRSICAECGAPKPLDPKTDPYLYHVTLGGLKKTEDKSVQNDDKENDDRYYHQSGRVTHQGTNSKIHPGRTPGDTSKHVFAKLNRSIDNIFPGRSALHFRPRAADQLRYQGHLHSKRHPSKSMALVDHLV
ncbi:uncharacterized protein [Penaeus vannamei]|uniref:uncharacterized protein isoform X2 n=1 Tax=Penaeus vannamei TaxID=6689 RepID=UPI00387F56F4